MPKYKPFPENNEVMDVLCCVILEKSQGKEMMKILKQPQSTVSTKLQFLLVNRIVKKNKWNFEPNWNVIKKIFQGEVRRYFENRHLDILFMLMGEKSVKQNRKLLKDINRATRLIPIIFNDKRIITIYDTYAKYFLKGQLEKMSTKELALISLIMSKWQNLI